MPGIDFGEVLYDVSYLRNIALEAMLLKLHTKLTPGWALIRVNFDPNQKIGPKVGGGRSFVSDPFSRDYSILLDMYVVHTANSWIVYNNWLVVWGSLSYKITVEAQYITYLSCITFTNDKTNTTI